tara:strand:- start:2716 stop:3111 length:396 start_codon:yes stop_codon:yes gene_type:complete
MPSFSGRSAAKLSECDERLQKVFNEVVKHFDCTVLEGRRSKERQDELYRTGKSKVQYPNSKHNVEPLSMACDVAPYPIDWNDKSRFYFFGGFVLGIAKSMGIDLRWGGDWDSDMDINDQTFMDLPHFEVKE